MNRPFKLGDLVCIELIRKMCRVFVGRDTSYFGRNAGKCINSRTFIGLNSVFTSEVIATPGVAYPGEVRKSKCLGHDFSPAMNPTDNGIKFSARRWL